VACSGVRWERATSRSFTTGFSTAELLSALSEFATLNPGDAILLGTPQSRVEIRPVRFAAVDLGDDGQVVDVINGGQLAKRAKAVPAFGVKRRDGGAGCG
jgi:2-keto-4-pentenoate hydratase/2-oxohepta-3-ene-1,7-dioic acid hydratase in catechol pathway